MGELLASPDRDPFAFFDLQRALLHRNNAKSASQSKKSVAQCHNPPRKRTKKVQKHSV